MNIVVVGAGLAGAKAVEELREQGYGGDVTLVGAEHHTPVRAAAALQGTAAGDRRAGRAVRPRGPVVRRARGRAGHRFDPVTALDLAGRTVTVGDRSIAYDRLLLATGVAAAAAGTPSTGPGPTVTYLRTLEDSLALKDRLAGDLLVIGAGWIGLEVASAARNAGGSVTVVETAALPLRGVLGPEVAASFADLHREHGVDLRLETGLESISSDGGRTTAVLSRRPRGPPGPGAWSGSAPGPTTGSPRSPGLATDNGVLVDAAAPSRRPADVWAAGDVANHDHPALGRLRVEHWDNAIHQGKHAARAMLGDDAAYDRQPYFFTDQYDLGMEYVGHVGAGRLRRGRGPRRPVGVARVHGAVGQGRPGRGRDARQRLGRHRPPARGRRVRGDRPGPRPGGRAGRSGY